MRLLRIGSQTAVNPDKIIRLHVTGTETRAQLAMTLLDIGELPVSWHKSFAEAELALTALSDRIAALDVLPD